MPFPTIALLVYLGLGVVYTLFNLDDVVDFSRNYRKQDGKLVRKVSWPRFFKGLLLTFLLWPVLLFIAIH